MKKLKKKKKKKIKKKKKKKKKKKIIEDRLASKEEAVSGKAKITVKGKKYVMDVIFRLRLYLINLLNDLKFVAADEILMKYSVIFFFLIIYIYYY